MADKDLKVVKKFRFFNVLEDGSVDFIFNIPRLVAPPSPSEPDPATGVLSKDAIVSPEVSVRIFLPTRRPDPDSKSKLPVLFYVHGGGFCMLSPFHPQYHSYVQKLAADAGAIAVSVDYGLFPARPIPACYEDSWAALQWVAAHSTGSGPDPWLNEHADFNRVFLAGDSAGGNISHTLAFKVGSIGLPGRVRVVGAVLVHPFFGGSEDDDLWLHMCPTNEGPKDPRMRPPAEDLARIGCERVLVFVAEKDHLRNPGMTYYEDLKKSGWKWTAEIVENKGRDHCFHLFNREDEQAIDNHKRIVSFITQED